MSFGALEEVVDSGSACSFTSRDFLGDPTPGVNFSAMSWTMGAPPCTSNRRFERLDARSIELKNVVAVGHIFEFKSFQRRPWRPLSKRLLASQRLQFQEQPFSRRALLRCVDQRNASFD